MNSDNLRRFKPIITIVALIGVGIAAFISVNFNYVLSEEAVIISRGSGITIPFAEMTDVRYFDRLPALSNRVGTSLGKIRSGTFTVAEVGRGSVYAKDFTRPAVIIFTAGTFYAITPEDARAFYEQVVQKIGN
ncbi:MAG TPA: PH domain-containing protein [Bacillota bacterium]|nr:PH domain-containing protein [Bacillota bacterium]